MKRVIIILVILLINFCGISQTLQQIDSVNVHLRDSIYNVKSDFIGKPFAYLADALNNNFSFSLPSGSNRTKGIGYYKNPAIFLKGPVGVQLCGFRIEFAVNMPVDLGKMRAVGFDQWDILMKSYLRTAIVTAMRKID